MATTQGHGNSATVDFSIAEYYHYADNRCRMYYQAVESGAITMQQAVYSLRQDLRDEWTRLAKWESKL